MTSSADIELELIATPIQQEIIACRSKFLCLMAGRRWGKTIGVIRNRIVSRCMEEPGFRYLLCAPSIAQVEPEYSEIMTHPALIPFIKKAVARPYPKIHWHNGSVACFRSLERSHLIRRDGFDEIWVDEIQDVAESIVDRVLLPMIADRRGILGMSGQSRGKEHFIHKRFFVPGQNPEKHHMFRSWRFSIEDGMMFQDDEGKAEVEALREVTPLAVWESEYLALPTANSRAVFRYEDLKAITVGTPPKRGEPGKKYILSVDLGRIADPSAFVVLDCDPDMPKIVASEIRPMRERHEITSQIVAREKRRWNDATVVLDSTGSGKGSASRVDEYIREYQKAVPDAIPFLWDHRSKKKILDKLCIAIEQHRIQIPACFDKLHHQLGAYEYTDKGEWISFSAPQGEHDDLVAAIAMGWNAFVLGWGGRLKSLGQLAGL